jgi:hypothetical protein
MPFEAIRNFIVSFGNPAGTLSVVPYPTTMKYFQGDSNLNLNRVPGVKSFIGVTKSCCSV